MPTNLLSRSRKLLKSDEGPVGFSVDWADSVVQINLILTRRNWRRLAAGNALRIRGKGYCYEGNFFWDYWRFEGGIDGALRVEFGDDGGVGWEGTAKDAWDKYLDWARG